MKSINRKSFRIVTPAVGCPVDRETLKAYLKIDSTTDDTLLNFLTKAAQNAIDRYCNRFFMNTTLEYTMDGLNDQNREPLAAGYFQGHKATVLGISQEFDLPFRPIVSITSIKTYDTNNVETTVSPSIYNLDKTGGRVYLNQDAQWPSDLRTREAIKVVYVAGYGANTSDVPFDVQEAYMMHVAKMYECRDNCELSDACKAALAPYRTLDDLGWC